MSSRFICSAGETVTFVIKENEETHRWHLSRKQYYKDGLLIIPITETALTCIMFSYNHDAVGLAYLSFRQK